MKKVKKKKLGIVSVKPTGAFDPNRNYKLLEECLYDHDSWYSGHGDNQGNTPSDTPDENGVIHWYRGTHGGKHAYDEGESAKTKGNKAEQQGNTTEGKGRAAAAAAIYANLMAQHPPVVGKSLPGHDADDNWWYYFQPNEDFTGGTYLNSGVYAKGDNLDFNKMTPEDEERLTAMILDNLSIVTEQEAHAIWDDYDFSTTD